MSEKDKEILFTDIDILESISSDLCEAVRDLIYNVKTIKHDVDTIKKYLQLKDN